MLDLRIQNRDFIGLNSWHGAYTFGIDRGDVWSLVPNYEGHTITLDGVLARNLSNLDAEKGWVR